MNLELDLSEPYIEIILILKDSTFVAKKAKMFEEKNQLLRKPQLMVFKLMI